MKLFRLIALLAAVATELAYGQEPDLRSDPVDWTQAHADGQSLALDGVFEVMAPAGCTWKTPTVRAPEGKMAIRAWEFDAPNSGEGKGKIIVMDMNVGRAPENMRSPLVSAVLTTYRDSGAKAMAKRNFQLVDFKIADTKSRWAHSMMAMARFHKGELMKVLYIYVYPGNRTYILQCEGPSEAEPAWFSEVRQSFSCN